MKTRLLNRPAGAALALAVLLVPTAIGVTSTSAHAVVVVHNRTVRVGSETADMAVQGERFLPGDVTIDAGDTVTWKGNSSEIHTVSFFDGGTVQTSVPQFNGDPSQVAPAGTDTMGAGYFNSGLMTNGASYVLHFPDPGTYTYYCLVHGIMMRGVVHVQPSGTAYPYSQADLNAQAAFEAQALAQHGRAQMAKARAASSNHRVFTGTDDLVTMTMRFSLHKIVVHKGDTVRFLNTMSMGAPHTVTFGRPKNPFAPSGNHDNYKGGNLSSGFMPPHAKFKVTFNKVGKFHYVCVFHSYMGMKGVVVVKP